MFLVFPARFSIACSSLGDDRARDACRHRGLLLQSLRTSCVPMNVPAGDCPDQLPAMTIGMRSSQGKTMPLHAPWRRPEPEACRLGRRLTRYSLALTAMVAVHHRVVSP